jgi:hypothetical protein
MTDQELHRVFHNWWIYGTEKRSIMDLQKLHLGPNINYDLSDVLSYSDY